MLVKRFIKRAARSLGYEINRIGSGSRCVSLRPTGAPKGNALLAYIIDPFLAGEDDLIPRVHTHFAESLLIARVLLDSGYCVDVIDYRDPDFEPQKDYALFVSARTNLEAIAARLNDDCTIIAHLDTAHFLFNDSAAFARLLDLQRRRNVTVFETRFVEQNRAIEVADYGVVLGNDFTLGTYEYAGKPMFRLSVPTPQQYPMDERKDYEESRTRFLWFGGDALVHKGLDLVLEAFTEMPELELVVCGPIDRENDFRNEFSKELYHTPNIETLGWMDVGSAAFLEVARRCVAFVYPSCSEGQAGAAVTCMKAGLIPIVSYESGVDVHDSGCLLAECSVSEIKDRVRGVAALPPEELRSRAERTWRRALHQHDPEHYVTEYKRIIGAIEAGDLQRASKRDL
jgi:glycosyltransferase involved in cell wall biosynthesis